jgi:hypothetical protein
MDQSKSKKWPVQSCAAAAGAESVQCAHAYSIISLFNDFTFNPQLRSYLDEEQAQALKTMVCLCVCGGGAIGFVGCDVCFSCIDFHFFAFASSFVCQDCLIDLWYLRRFGRATRC